MKALLDIAEIEVKIELTNVTVEEFIRIGEKINFNLPTVTEKYPFGDPIVLITSNMPSGLKDSIVELIKEYCNH